MSLLRLKLPWRLHTRVSKALEKYIINRARGGLILGKSLGRKRDLGKAGEGSCSWPCSTSRDLWDPPGMGAVSGVPLKTPRPGILAWEFSADKVLLVQEEAWVCLLYLANEQEVRNARQG